MSGAGCRLLAHGADVAADHVHRVGDEREDLAGGAVDRVAGALERLLAGAVRGRSARGLDRRVVGGAGGGMVVHAAARCRSDEFEVHVEGERPAGGQLVGRVYGGSPGVVSADAHLGREQAQVVVARFGQVLVAARGLDRVGVPGQQAGREVTVAALGDAQSVALDVGGFEPADVLVAAGFLHHEIRRHARLRGGVPDAELAAMLTVAVGLLGAGAVVAQTIVFAGQLPFDAERGQTGHVSGVPGVFDGQLHTHIGVDMVSDGHGRVVRIGKLVLVFRYETVIAFMDFRFGYDGVSAGREPCGTVETGMVAAIVVGQWAERDEFGATDDHFPVVALPGDDASLSA